LFRKDWEGSWFKKGRAQEGKAFLRKAPFSLIFGQKKRGHFNLLFLKIRLQKTFPNWEKN